MRSALPVFSLGVVMGCCPDQGSVRRPGWVPFVGVALVSLLVSMPNQRLLAPLCSRPPRGHRIASCRVSGPRVGSHASSPSVGELSLIVLRGLPLAFVASPVCIELSIFAYGPRGVALGAVREVMYSTSPPKPWVVLPGWWTPLGGTSGA